MFVSIRAFLTLEMPSPPAVRLQEGLSTALSLLPHIQGRRQDYGIREEAGVETQKDHHCICRKPLMYPRLRGPYEQAKTPTGEVFAMSQQGLGVARGCFLVCQRLKPLPSPLMLHPQPELACS